MTLSYARICLLVFATIVGFVCGNVTAPAPYRAIAAGAPDARTIAEIESRIAANSKAIAALQRQYGGLDRKVASNRDAARTIASQSGIAIQFRD